MVIVDFWHVSIRGGLLDAWCRCITRQVERLESMLVDEVVLDRVLAGADS